MYLVMLAYSLLMSELKQGRAKEWAFQRLMTIGEACRAMEKETLRSDAVVGDRAGDDLGRSYDHVVAQVGLS